MGNGHQSFGDDTAVTVAIFDSSGLNGVRAEFTSQVYKPSNRLLCSLHLIIRGVTLSGTERFRALTGGTEGSPKTSGSNDLDFNLGWIGLECAIGRQNKNLTELSLNGEAWPTRRVHNISNWPVLVSF